MILVIQTNIPGQIFFWLRNKQQIKAADHVLIEIQAVEKALTHLDIFLRHQKISLKKLQGITVVRGPGRFTAVRTGLLIGNTLAVQLKIPINGIVASQPVTPTKILAMPIPVRHELIRPWYGKGPNITRPTTRSSVQPRAGQSRGQTVAR